MPRFITKDPLPNIVLSRPSQSAILPLTSLRSNYRHCPTVKIKESSGMYEGCRCHSFGYHGGPEHRGGAGGLPTWRLHVFLDPRVGTDVRRSFALQLTHVR
jgi:hypothetical protein